MLPCGMEAVRIRGVVMPACNLYRGVSLVTALTVLLGIGVAAEARDLRGAWVTDKSTCKKVFTGEGTKLRIAKDADIRQWFHLRERQAERKKCELRYKDPETGRRRSASRNALHQ